SARRRAALLRRARHRGGRRGALRLARHGEARLDARARVALPRDARPDRVTNRTSGDAAQWRRVGEIFDAALERPAAERDAFVASACAGDAALEADVRSLLASHQSAGDFLEPGAAPLAIPTIPLPEALAVEGRTLGAWRVVRAIGEGGMGTVYLAE